MRRIMMPVIAGLLLAACGDDSGTGGTGGSGASTSDGGGGQGGEAQGAGPQGGENPGGREPMGGEGGQPPTEECGDGSIDGSEECDDGNTDEADGCDNNCEVEVGFECRGEPSVCETSCGDGLIAGDEECDDSNVKNLDGCSSMCGVESGYECDGEPSTCTADCGDGLIAEGAEECDDNNVAVDDGCSDDCVVEDGWSCDQEPSVCETGCGDGIIAGTEECDDNNMVAGDGCSDACVEENGYTCTGEPSTCVLAGSCASPIVATDGFVFQAPLLDPFGDDLDLEDVTCAADSSGTNVKPDLVFSVALLAGETLHVAESGDADVLMHVLTGACASATPCAASVDGIGTTEITPGLTYTSPSAQTVLVVIDTWGTSDAGEDIDLLFEINPCGNGTVDPGEGCDDSDATGGDGCSALCTVEPGFLCSGSPSVCNAIPAANCANPIVVTGNNFTFAGTNIAQFGDTENYNAGTGCLDVSTTPPSGFDVVFRANLLAGQTVRFSEQGTIDAVLHIMTAPNCGAGLSCSASTDGGEATGITFTAVTAGPVFLVGESFGNPGATTTYDFRVVISQCGDGVLGGSEICDDGNTVAGDGCNATCAAVEAGFACDGGGAGSCFSLAGCTTATCVLGTCPGGTIVTGTGMGLPVNIPDGDPNGGVLGNVQVVIPIAATGTVRKMVSRFSVNHAFDADLDFYISGPTGPLRDVNSDNGGSGVNFINTFLRDGVATAVTAGVAPFTGVFRPETAFGTSFTGMTVTGNWTLRVEDDFGPDTGSIQSWDLAFCLNP